MPSITKVYANTPLNTTEIPQKELDITHKLRHNPLKWQGQFSPQLVQTLLKHYATPDMVLFDPFLGSGTVLLEAGLAGLAACGTEINPAAVMLARVYSFINVSLPIRQHHLQTVFDKLQTMQEFEWGIVGVVTAEEVKTKLVKFRHCLTDCLQKQLLETLIVLLDFYEPDLSLNKVFTVWYKLKKLILELPFSARPLQIVQADARQTCLPAASVNLVVTSPPYINVFNYHQQYRASVEALSWDLLKVAPSEFGSNRKHRGNRFLTVIQFCLDMAQVFQELARLTLPDSRLIFVVGRESMVLGTRFLNGQIVADVAHNALGCNLLLRQERMFRNRFGQDIYEDILHFSVPQVKSCSQILDVARSVAEATLTDSYTLASPDVKEGIKSALDNIAQVQPSPVFSLENVRKNNP